MKMKKRDLTSLLALMSMSATIIYIVVRKALFIFSDYSNVEKFFAVMLVAGELFVLMHALGYSLNIIKSAFSRKAAAPRLPGLEKGHEPSVAVIVAARHEPKEVLERTFMTLKAMDYVNKTVYFLDDSSDEQYKKEAEELCEELDIVLYRRETRHGAKAGIVNDFLKTVDQKYLAVFDADQNPLPDFLKKLVPVLEADEKIAFVQSPQFYTNIDESPVARASAFQQAVFYEYICEGKNTQGAMFCCGTNIVFRREALSGVGGLDESTVTEDFATSLKLHMKGWKSVYFNHVYAFGMGPADLGGYFKQQFRWAAGTITVFKRILFNLITRPFALRAGQWWEYMLSGSYYMIGLAFFFLTICPIMYLLFKVPSFFARPEIYFLAFIPYFVLSVSVFYSAMGARSYSPRDLFIGQLLASAAFTVYVRAALSAILGVKTTFGITQKGKADRLPYYRLWPQLFFAYLAFAAAVWGLNRYVYQREPAILVNAFWAVYQAALLSSVFYFNRGVSE